MSDILKGAYGETLDESETAKFGNSTFDKLPKALKMRCITNIVLFCGAGLFTAILAVAFKEWVFLVGSAALIIFGIVATLFIMKYFKEGKILEISGVLISKDKDGYRKQNKYINVEDDCNRVYRLLITEKIRRYKVGDIITFYTTKDAISKPIDAEYRVYKIYAVERYNASVDGDNGETSNNEEETFDDLVIKPDDKDNN